MSIACRGWLGQKQNTFYRMKGVLDTQTGFRSPGALTLIFHPHFTSGEMSMNQRVGCQR